MINSIRWNDIWYNDNETNGDNQLVIVIMMMIIIIIIIVIIMIIIMIMINLAWKNNDNNNTINNYDEIMTNIKQSVNKLTKLINKINKQ